MQPQHQATLRQPLQFVLQHPVANLHGSTHIATEHDNNHAAIESFQCDLQPQIQETHRTMHTQEQPLVAEHRRGTKTTPATPAAHRRYLSSPAAATLYGKRMKNTRFRAPASSPKQSPCNIHAAITMRFAASRRKPARIYAHSNRA